MAASAFAPSHAARQRGVALLTALLLMLAVLLTSIAGARTAINGARSAGHERDRMLALQTAMAALADAEHDIEGGSDPASARAAALANANPATPAAFADGCGGAAPYEGLCAHAPDPDAIFAALADDAGPGIVLGTFTGTQMPAGEGGLPAQAPRYLIERMPSPAGSLLYRVTALGFGSAKTSQVALQAYYRKLLAAGPPAQPGPPGTAPGQGRTPGPQQGPASEPAPESGPDAGPGRGDPAQDESPAAPGRPGSPGGPGIRVGWREIGNWNDTLAAAGESARAGWR